MSFFEVIGFVAVCGVLVLGAAWFAWWQVDRYMRHRERVWRDGVLHPGRKK